MLAWIAEGMKRKACAIAQGGCAMKCPVTKVAVGVALGVIALFCGCGGGSKIGTPGSSTNASTPNVAGNWEFTATPSAMGRSPMTVAGGIRQAGTAVSSALHVLGTSCFSRLTTVILTGSVAHGMLLLTSAAVDEQVVTLNGSVNASNFGAANFAGTYKIKGGCADGDEGSVVGTSIPTIANDLSGTFTNSAHGTFHMAGGIAENESASADGSYGITGSATFDTPCFKAGTLRAGTYSDGSFILGSTVALEFETENGSLIFVGTLSRDRSTISGSYELAGGTCDKDGTALLSFASGSPWDY